VAAVGFATGIGAVVVASPAYAALTPSTGITITWTSTSHTVCADGSATAASLTVWTFTIVGARSDGSPIAVPVPPATGAVFHDCEVIYKKGADGGNYTATLTATPAAAQVSGVAAADGTWAFGADRYISLSDEP
jgi:hypothetical protein